MRVWLQKQKKKEEAKVAAQIATPPVEATPTAPEVQAVGASTEKPVESVEEIHNAESATAESAPGTTESTAERVERADSSSARLDEVGLECFISVSCAGTSEASVPRSFVKGNIYPILKAMTRSLPHVLVVTEHLHDTSWFTDPK